MPSHHGTGMAATSSSAAGPSASFFLPAYLVIAFNFLLGAPASVFPFIPPQPTRAIWRCTGLALVVIHSDTFLLRYFTISKKY
ncbi:hypothetical protein V1523DRAFT_421599 [Lipomyces doorenjongii]